MEAEINVGCCIWSLIELKDGRIAAGLGNGDVHIIDIASKKSVIEYKGHIKTVNCLLEIEGGRLISGSDDGSIIMWNLEDPNEKYVFENGHTSPVCSLIKLGDYKIASASKESIKIWE